MQELAIPELTAYQKQAYQDVSLGRPLSVYSIGLLEDEFAAASALQINRSTGLLYAAGNDIAKMTDFGIVDGVSHRLTPTELIKHAQQQVEQADIIDANAYQSMDVYGSNPQFITKGGKNFCRLFVSIMDVPAPASAAAAGRLLNEKAAVAQLLTPNHVPKLNRRLRDIVHAIPIGYAPTDYKETLESFAARANRGLGTQLKLDGLGAVRTSVRG